jgi:hypothetical protein
MTGRERATWGRCVGAFERAHPDWKIESDGLRYSARRKVGGRPQGHRLTAPDLDALAARIDDAEGSKQ